MSFQSHQNPDDSKNNVYTGFIFFVVLIALVAALTIYVLNHKQIYSQVTYEQKLEELDKKSTITITHTQNTISINAKKEANMKILIDSEAYEFTLSKGQNKISFALYNSPDSMLSINNQINDKQNYLHAIPSNSTLAFILPSEISINALKNTEILILGHVFSETDKTIISAEFTIDEAANEN